MDLSNEKDSGCKSDASSSSNQDPKCCSNCGTIKTPLWRHGPNGPKTLCNACGIKYKKKRREGKSTIVFKKKRTEGMLGEEEKAALLLMQLSSGLLNS